MKYADGIQHVAFPGIAKLRALCDAVDPDTFPQRSRTLPSGKLCYHPGLSEIVECARALPPALDEIERLRSETATLWSALSKALDCPNSVSYDSDKLQKLRKLMVP